MGGLISPSWAQEAINKKQKIHNNTIGVPFNPNQIGNEERVISEEVDGAPQRCRSCVGDRERQCRAIHVPAVGWPEPRFGLFCGLQHWLMMTSRLEFHGLSQ